MQNYNSEKNKSNNFIYSGEELDLAGVLHNDKGEEIDFTAGSVLTLIIRNMNGVVYKEFSSVPTSEQGRITISGHTFKAKLETVLTKTMVGLFVIETRLTQDDNTFIDVSEPFEVRDDFVKRTEVN